MINPGLASVLGEQWQALPMAHLLAANLVICMAAGVQYALGIAFGLVAAPLLALISLAFVPAPVVMLTCVTAFLSLRGEWGAIAWSEVRIALGGRLAGSVAGAGFLALLSDERLFTLVFGLLIAVAVIFSAWGLRVAFNLFSVGLAGGISGFTAALTGVGGPPLALVYQDRKASEARPTLQVFFALGALVTLIVLGLTGHLTLRDPALAILLLPGLACGYLLGPVLRRFADHAFRLLLLASAAVASLLLVAKALV